MSPTIAPAVSLGLLHGFQLRCGVANLALPLSAQRVIAFLALHERPLQRLFVAGNLWLESSEERANASLRTALWRLRRPDCRLVRATASHIALAPEVAVDVRAAAASARRAIQRESDEDDLAELRDAGDLLPDWYDDWVLIERERFRQLRLHALEAVCDTLTAAGRHGEAAEAALAAIAVEPLRESAHRALIRTHLAEGNPGEAIRQYRVFRDLLGTQLGLEPSSLMRELVSALPIR
jgi:DNA-binding SARP family transcriptional activator